MFVHSYPEWINFNNTIFSIDTILQDSSTVAVFNFSVDQGQSGRVDSVLFLIVEMPDHFLGMHTVVFKGDISLSESSILSTYPNPANPGTTISFGLKEAGHVKIEVINILGQHVRTVLNTEKPAGLWKVYWDGSTEFGTTTSSGIYFIRFYVKTSSLMRTKIMKLMLVR